MSPGTRVETDDVLRRRGRIMDARDNYLSARGFVLVVWDEGSTASWVPTRCLVQL